jgi:DNA-binding CsgD family transcriptional regulator/PAS domain-containing protein
MATLGGQTRSSGARALWSHWTPAPATLETPAPRKSGEELSEFLEEIRRAAGADEVLLTLGGGTTAPHTVGRSGRGLSADAEIRIACAEADDFGCNGPDEDWNWCRLDGNDWRVRRVHVSSGPGGCSVSLHLLYKSSILNGSAAARLAGLRPMIDSYLRLWLRMRAQSRQTAACRGALDALDLGVLLLDRSGQISFANRAAVRLLDAGEPLRRSGGGFTATSLQQAMSVQVAMSHSVAANCAAEGAGAAPRRATIVTLRSSREERALLLAVVPAEQPASEPGDVAAIAYLVDPGFDSERQLSPVCRLFGLSPVETRLVCELARGHSLQEAAAAMRIKDQTARSYLKQIFLKTDTRRQADLVRTMLCSLVRTDRSIEAESLG